MTPGPGHYHKIDEQYSRTFHHATKNQRSTSINGGSPTTTAAIFSLTGQSPTNLQVVKGFTEMGDIGVKDNLNTMAIEPAVVTSKANKTSIGFFGREDSSHQFLDTMLGYGSGNYGGKLQQPPMMAGKARVPSSDLNNSFVMKRKSTRKALHHHKTIEHNQTASSIAQNISFTHEPKIGVRKSNKVHAGRFSGRNSFLAGKQSPIMSKVISPKVRSIVIDQNGSHIDDGQLAEQQNIAVAPAFIKMTEDLNIASGDVICSDDYTLRATQDFSNLMNKNRA